MRKKTIKFLYLLAMTYIIAIPSLASELRNKPAMTNSVVNYARSLLLTIVDTNFRGSWVIDPENWHNVSKVNKTSFTSLANIKIGSNSRDVRKILKNPKETRNNGKIWVYGMPNTDGTYKDLLQVFFDEKQDKVTGVISFAQKNIVEKIGINIGDQIDKMISAYGEPLHEKDFIEDPENKEYLGLYYLYPRSGIGFLIGQDKTTDNLLVQGVLVFGKIQ